MRGLEHATEHLHERLKPVSTAPLAVALSGGGDSVALLALTMAWAGACGRRVLALTVDHGLQPESPVWSRFAGDLARRLGAEHQVLSWNRPKPATRLALAARRARHALLAEAAREAGASVLLLGHTADDRLEEALMRAEGVPLGRLRSWAPSPAWPEGRGVFLLRPLLDVRRAAIRDWLRIQRLEWIDDPANEDLRQPRARLRAEAAGQADPPPAKAIERSPLLDALEVTLDGRVIAPRERLLAAADRRRVTAAAMACASGQAGTIRPERVEAVIERMRGAPFTATLGGARCDVTPERVSFAREPGRIGLPEVPLGERATVWDGRFEVASPNGTVGPLAGRIARLPQAQRAVLKSLPASVRGVLPAVQQPDGGVTCPLLEEKSAVTLKTLAGPRLIAALGGVVREA